MQKVKVAVVGLGFGAEFIPLYQRHPDAECYAICQRAEDHLNEIGNPFGIERRFTRFEDLLSIDELGAIHVVSPIADDAWTTVASLNAGKHTACTVPMATTVKDCLAKKPVESVVCYGSGVIAEDYVKHYNSPFAIETAVMKLKGSAFACEVTRSLFDTIRQYRESFDVYGTKLSFEWEQIAGDGPVIYSGYEDAKRIEVPDYGHLLPKEIAPFRGRGVYDEEHEHTSFIQGAGDGGCHPHLAHEFVRAIIENRESAVDGKTAANWTMAGICAHESATNAGKRIEIPQAD